MASHSGLNWWLDQISRVPLLTAAEEIELGNTVQAWLNHPGYPDDCPSGIRRRGQRARERFTSANLRLAVHYVSKHCHRQAKDHSVDDLIQAANEGVIKAVERFDPTRGYRFSTYAYWWIRQSVNAWIDRHSRLITIPGSHSQYLGRLSATVQRLQAERGRPPTREELAEGLGVSERVLEQLLSNGRPVSSLDVAITEDGIALGELIASYDQSLEDQEEAAERLRQAEQLRSLIRTLPPSDQQLLTMAYGLDGVDRSHQQLAKELGANLRTVEYRLRILHQQLRGMTVQLVFVAVPLTPVPTRQHMPRKRKGLWLVNQLALPLEVPAPAHDAKPPAQCLWSSHRQSSTPLAAAAPA